MKQAPRRAAEQGSAVIYIFIAIALFVALSFTVSNMMRGGGEGIRDELVNVHAGEITQFGDMMRRAVQTMRIDGVDTGELSFENNFVSGYDNTRCGDESCLLFHPAGGGVNYARPNAEWLDSRGAGENYFAEWYFPRNVCVPGVGNGEADCDSDGTDNEELMAMLLYVKKPLCIEINRILNIDNPDGNPPQDTGCAWSHNQDKRYEGSFENGHAITSDPAAILTGRQSGCFQTGSCGSVPANSYHFYQVLRAR